MNDRVIEMKYKHRDWNLHLPALYIRMIRQTLVWRM